MALQQQPSKQQLDQEFFVGIDVSKAYFDASLLSVTDYHLKSKQIGKRFDNDAEGLKDFGKWLSKQGATTHNTYCLMENTGLYHRPLWFFFAEPQTSYRIHIGNAARIKWSLGITRGKDDKTDTSRLCNYALKEAKDLRMATAPTPALIELKDIDTIRKGLLKDANGQRVRLSELEATTPKESLKMIAEAIGAVVKCIEQQLILLQKRMSEIVATNKELHDNYKLLLSVPGIGPITARYLICCTMNFANMPSGKQLSCYAGVAPFSSTSGSSVRGKARVHKMANKDLKTLLHMGALSAVRFNEECRLYYKRKLAEGKHVLSVLNAIKAKILQRVAAVIRDQKVYEKKLKIAA